MAEFTVQEIEFPLFWNSTNETAKCICSTPNIQSIHMLIKMIRPFGLPTLIQPLVTVTAHHLPTPPVTYTSRDSRQPGGAGECGRCGER